MVAYLSTAAAPATTTGGVPAPSVRRFLVGVCGLAALRIFAVVVVMAADLRQAFDEGISRAVPSLFSLSRNPRHSRAGASLLLLTSRSWPTVHRTESRSCHRRPK